MTNAEAAIAIITVVVGLGVGGVVAVVWLLAWRARAPGDREEAYERLTESIDNSQRRTAFELGQIAEDIADVRNRMVELERMLKEVG